LHNQDLPYHVARKKIPFFSDATRTTVTPSSNNGIKLEKFVFDVFQFSDNFVVWECKREEEFSPLKNAEGASQDTPTTAREALFALHKVYVERSGGSFETGTNKSGSDGKIISNGQTLANGESKDNGESNDNDGLKKKPEEQCICEISPLLSYAGENLEKFVQAKKVFKSPALLF
jgi:UDP-N-acetylglucosamine/UDP-N-acetylgalactosamine diphosphorylase